MLETPTVDPPSKAGPEGLSPTEVGTSLIKGGEPRPKGFSHFSHGLSPGCPSSSRPNEFSQDKARTPSFLPKSTLVRAKDPLLSSAKKGTVPLSRCTILLLLLVYTGFPIWRNSLVMGAQMRYHRP